jgi:DNA-binding MarR family transcriptional regulator
MGYVIKNKSEKDSRGTIVQILPKAGEIKDKIQKCWEQSSELALQGISKSEQVKLLFEYLFINRSMHNTP